MRARYAPLLIVAAVLLTAGCEDVRSNVNGLRITVTWEQGLAIDHLQFSVLHEGTRVGQPVSLPNSDKALKPEGESVVVLLPDDLVGENVLARVDGLSGGAVVATGVESKKVVPNDVVAVEIQLSDPAECGNGELEGPAETCDDGDSDDGDGCSALCQKEEGWDCDDGSPTVCRRCGNDICEPGEDVCRCAQDCQAATCGDGYCCNRAGENACSCVDDCGEPVCGDGLCCVGDGQESTCSCQQDCGQEQCGNGVCCADKGEDIDNCQADCAFGCGDGACLGSEDTCTCPADCGLAECGDGICCAEQDEDFCSCPDDCGAGSCGDLTCCAAAGENPCTCARDCPQEPCGDGVCCTRSGEDICTCPDDCGQTTCGDDICCPPGEDEDTCPDDCLAVCGDGKCTTGEDVCNCPDDCDGATCGDGNCCPDGGEDNCSCQPDCFPAGCEDGNCCGDGICCIEQGEDRCTCSNDCGMNQCGDGICCAPAENRCNCEADCGGGSCGDGVCCPQTDEDLCTCPDDCPGGECGDGICCAETDEDPCTCPADCLDPAFCGDGICCPEGDEDSCTCPGDCNPTTCGDGLCCPGQDEDRCTCEPDCGASTCGDGICCPDTGEDEASCPEDCAAECGDTTCQASESPCTCPTDCGATTCGDTYCCPDDGEDPCTCQQDCGASICGDTVCCEPAETPCNCKVDCGLTTCGDTFCCPADGEDACTCLDDCGPVVCGDGACCADDPDTPEDRCNCPDDCGAGSCGDGICCEPGEDSNNCPEDCGAGCPNVALGVHLSTAADVPDSGNADLAAWAAGDVLQLTDPGLAMEPDTTAGTLGLAFSLDAFAADGDANIDAFHRVGQDSTIGSQAPFQLLAGDLLFSTDDAEELGADLLAVTGNDVILFRPDVPEDYSAGTFQILLDGDVVVDTDLVAMTFVEQDVQLADFLLPAGSLLVSQTGVVPSKYVFLFAASQVGAGTTVGDRSTFISNQSLGIPNKNPTAGLDILERCLIIGGRSLPAGTLLLVTSVPADLSGAAVQIQPQDVAAVILTTTHAGSGTTNGTASLLLEGADIGLDSVPEEVDALGLILP